MASLYITEYSAQGIDAAGNLLPVGKEPAIVVQKIAIGAGSVQSAVFDPRTAFVELHTDAICSYLFGTNPTATASQTRMAANQTKFVAVTKGHRVAVITNT